MDVIGEGGNAGGEGFSVPGQATVHACIGFPEVVDHDVAVAEIRQT